MWIEDLTKAMYFLNATDYKYTVCIEKIEKNVVFFSNRQCISVKRLADAYDKYIKTGKLVDLW